MTDQSESSFLWCMEVSHQQTRHNPSKRSPSPSLSVPPSVASCSKGMPPSSTPWKKNTLVDSSQGDGRSSYTPSTPSLVQLVPIDFGYSFGIGALLPVPELMPFRALAKAHRETVAARGRTLFILSSSSCRRYWR